MSSLLEFHMADILAQAIDAHGACGHQCMAQQPFGLCEVEDRKLQRFDPEGHAKLHKLGFVHHQIEIEDIDLVASLVTALHNAQIVDMTKDNEHLYKHAIAVRVDKS
ncbi:hypothetical protein [Ensifer sesbaniae]|uniref:hypothetical protein n=1 Tax=Ensifer sesbaniae TaxID=1214071 RepID=UPI00156A2D1A|nr:hypothetical protein [Ensifer sesbaniae]NRQ14941.1 hypothetical protein [Ensifer sesbaniae]